MKIDNLEGMRGSQVTEVGSQHRLKEPTRKTQITPQDSSAEIDISEKARLMKTAFDTAKNAPDVSAKRVSELRERIKGGTYQVNAEELAERILSDHLGSNFGKNNL